MAAAAKHLGSAAVQTPFASRFAEQSCHPMCLGPSMIAFIAVGPALLMRKSKKITKRTAMKCGGGIVALAASMGGMLAADYAGKYLLGKSAQFLAAKMGQNATTATIAQVAAAAKQGQKWAQTASKIMTQARFMRDGWTVGKILGGVACVAPDSAVIRMVDGKAAACKVKELQVGDPVLTLNEKSESIWTDVHANVAHHLHYGHALVVCTVSGQDSSTGISATPNHRALVRRGDSLVTMCFRDLRCGDMLVGNLGQLLQVANITSSYSSYVYEVETGTGTVLLNNVMVLASATDYISGASFSQEVLLMQS